jgi:hypothetical protein
MKELKPIPDFKSEDEEFEFWSIADSTEYLDPAGWRRVPPPVMAGNEDTVFLQMPHALRDEVARLSREKKLSMEEMVRQLVAAGLKQQRVQPGA